MILRSGIYTTFLNGLQEPITGGTFASVGHSNSTSNNAQYSYDGINWNAVSGSAPLSRDLVYGGGLFVAVGNSSNSYSSDGINWNTTGRAISTDYYGVTYSPSLNLYCAVAGGFPTTNAIQTSTDGINWTLRTAPVSYSWYSVEWSDDLAQFCAVGSVDSAVGGACIMTSSDGINWTSRTPAPGADRLWDVVYAEDKGLWCAVGDVNTNKVMCSTDGINWTGATAANTNEFKTITYSQSLGLFAALSTDLGNEAMISTDGFNWTAQTLTNGGWRDVIWAGNGIDLFVGTSCFGEYVTSPDGVNWTVINATGIDEIQGIAFKEKKTV